jgi:hypothetical protein
MRDVAGYWMGGGGWRKVVMTVYINLARLLQIHILALQGFSLLFQARN